MVKLAARLRFNFLSHIMAAIIVFSLIYRTGTDSTIVRLYTSILLPDPIRFITRRSVAIYSYKLRTCSTESCMPGLKVSPFI